MAYSSTFSLHGVHNYILTFKWVHTISPWHHAVNPCWAPLPLKFRLINPPIIHFCSGGSIVTENKWPSRCLMSMIIILAICQGFAKHLIKTQHQAEMDSRQRHCLSLTNSLYWHSLNSLFAPLSLSLFACFGGDVFFFSLFHLGHFFNLSHPHPAHSSLSHPQPPPPPPSRSLDYVEPESGKVSLWKQGPRQRRAVDVRGEKETKKTKNWPVLRNPRVVFRCRYYSNERQGANDFCLYFWCGKSRCKSLLDFFKFFVQ